MRTSVVAWATAALAAAEAMVPEALCDAALLDTTCAEAVTAACEAALLATGADALDALWERTPVVATTRAKRMLRDFMAS